jgi:hypothetical protein
MKQYKSFDELLEMLKKAKPDLRQPEILTDQIMDQLSKQRGSQLKGIRMNVNSESWTIFTGFRNIASFAALFLISFFGYQQWEMMSKISSLEKEVHDQTISITSFDQIKNSNNANLKLLMSKQLRSKNTAFTLSDEEKAFFTADRNSFNLLIRKFEQLEDENNQKKVSIFYQFLDSLKKYNPTSSKDKSL